MRYVASICLLLLLAVAVPASGVIIVDGGASLTETMVAYDSFTRANAADLGSTEIAGPASEVLTAYAWTDKLGSYEVLSNRAEPDTVTGFAADTITLPQAASKVQAAVSFDVAPDGVAGICLAYVDDNNFIRAYHNGTNARLIKMIGGTSTTLINEVVVYAANASVRVDISGTTYTLYYNGSQVGTPQTISDAVFSGVFVYGLYTNTYSANLDAFTAWSML